MEPFSSAARTPCDSSPGRDERAALPEQWMRGSGAAFPRRQDAEYQSKHLTCPVVRPKAVISVSDISLLISMVALESLVARFTASTAATFSGQAAYQTLTVAPVGSGLVAVTTQPNTFSGMICRDERTPLLRGERGDARTEGVGGICFPLQMLVSRVCLK